MIRRLCFFSGIAFLFTSFSFAQQPAGRYAIFLQDEPAGQRFSTRGELQSAAASAYRLRVETAQGVVRAELRNRKIQVTGSVSTLLNAVFVTAPASRVAEMKGISGVLDVVPLHRHQALLNAATALMNGPAAWGLTAGGMSNAGAGIKIGILDTGIDQTHPALQDASLVMPTGFPKCSGADCAFTSNKVIVARSYIRQLAAGTDPANPAADSRPDDYSPRDRIGHGTATASSAAGNTATGAVTVNGMAPKAYVGNYKILGSPQVNDGTFDDIMVLALEDALKDGMDIVSLSVAGPAFTGPLDSGAACGLAAGVPCDVAASAFEAAAQKGLTIIVAAGNSGGNGFNYPLYNSINSPANAPSVIAAGATTNSHGFSGLVELAGAGVPASLNAITTAISDSFASGGAVTGPLVDVVQLGNDGFGCSAFPAGSLNGAVALIQRSGPSGCTFATKMGNAVDAGAVGVVFYMASAAAPISPGGLGSFIETAGMVSNADGLSLKSFVDSHPGTAVTIDPSALETGGLTPNQLASFSSFGPGLGTNGIKPDLLAVGESVYMPSQNYDPLGEMFSSNRYIFAAGTSFATPLIAGAAALVKQNHPGYTGAQIKSALVNTATQDVTVDDQRSPVTFLQTGPGKLAADNAIRTNVTVNPATLSFGAWTAASAPAPLQLQIASNGAGALTLAITQTGGGPIPALSSQTLSTGASGNVTVTLSGTRPAPGIYNGVITIQGGSVALRVPYMYLVGSGVATNLQVLSGDFDDGTAGQTIPDGRVALQLTDNQGLPVTGTPVSFLADRGITLTNVSQTTDNYGVAYATATLGPTPGTYSIYGCAAATCSSRFVNGGGLGYQFTEFSRFAPAITAAGIVDSASYSQPIAPGSYVTIFGSGLYDTTLSETGKNLNVANTLRLPLSLDQTMVSFDVPSANLSVPGHMYYVSPGQIALQVPWELQGQTSAQVKVTVGFSYGNVVTVPVLNYSPAIFPNGAFAAATNDKGVIGESNPAVQGSVITLYANGLGPVDHQPPSGDPTPIPSDVVPLARTTPNDAAVTIGGKTASVLFSGLAPGAVGLYQVNATVPAGLNPGIQQVFLSIGGQSSKAANLPVQ